MQMDILDWIDVGPVSAERDENLVNYFFDGGVLKTVLESERHFLILGRKGAGKTAVFQYLQTKPVDCFNSADLLVPLSLVDYSWNAHALLARPEKTGSMAQRDSWRLVIAVECIRAIALYCDEKSIKLSNEMSEALGTLEKVFAKPIPTWTELIAGKLFRLSKLRLPGGGLGSEGDFKVDGGEVSFEAVKADATLRERLSSNTEHLTTLLEAALETDKSRARVYLIFDRLDEAWTPGGIETCKEIVAGLLQAAEHALGKFKGRVRPLVFLREDIFPMLELNDKNKLRQDCSSTLMWDSAGLEQMLLRRLNFYGKSVGRKPISSSDELFDRKEMRNRTTPSRYILARTMMRPRDLVTYYKSIIASMKDSARDEFGTFLADEFRECLNADAIYDAESAFGDFLYDELLDEWKTQRPEIEQYLNAFANLGKGVFEPSELRDHLVKQGLAPDTASFQETLRFLYDNSIIGFQVGSSSIWRFKCTHPGQSYTDSPTFRVHNGLIKRLNLREPYKTESRDSGGEA
jgi:hypothetical protein